VPGVRGFLQAVSARRKGGDSIRPGGEAFSYGEGDSKYPNPCLENCIVGKRWVRGGQKARGNGTRGVKDASCRKQRLNY